MEADDDKAPVYPIPARQIAAVEHPALLRSLNRGLETFGVNVDYRKAGIVKPEGPQASLPLFLRHEDPSSSALVSHNAASHNVVLAVTLPARTGMKRKRGVDGPWEYDPSVATSAGGAGADSLGSGEGRLAGETLDQRNARLLRRMLQDNAGNYKVDVVGLVKHSHRYRGLFDFQQSAHDSSFMAKFTEKVLPGELSKLREFELTPGVAPPPHVDLPAPPFFTTQTLPFSYFYSQNPFVREVAAADGAVQLVNSTAATAARGYFLKFDHEPIPTAPPPTLPAMAGRHQQAVLAAMRQAVAERPVWTRRGLVSHMSAAMGLPFTENRLKPYFAHVCYQFKGGPWRDTLVRYGVDPRKDPAHRQYQTLLFQLHQQADRKRACWYSLRPAGGGGEEEEGRSANASAEVNANADPSTAAKTATQALSVPLSPGKGRQDTHIFDGRSYCDDGKIWQVCDITDPVLAAMLADAPVRPTCDLASTGWYHQGTWAKAKAIMKTKLMAVRFGRDVDASAFRRALAIGDATPRLGVRSIKVPVPDLHLTPEEAALNAMKTYHGQPRKRERRRGVTSFSVPVLTQQQRNATARTPGAEPRAAPSSAVSEKEPPGEDEEQAGEEDEIEEMDEMEEVEEEEEEEMEELEEDEPDDVDLEEDLEEEELEAEADEAHEDETDERAARYAAIKEEILDDVDENDNGGRRRR
ncbi:RNA polymerase 3 transcription factor [Niveomyces insectorum RCEF 264]|uniref:RNA polymerase 3 transcription factor n=1 Tax=Niveomyces insectorum RCEF 264 TaxID=1081102 RepID=A0A167YY60_9HYPO|nr:RNA polymerase 3 transcription factor [Niveomyces insectorum RCEF 264]